MPRRATSTTSTSASTATPPPAPSTTRRATSASRTTAVADPNSSEPAFAPHNDTDAYARLFTNPDCTGDSWTLRPHGNPASDRLKLRSVVFLRP